MATVTLKGNAVSTTGELPAVGQAAPDFRLVRGDLSEATLSDYSGKRKIINIVPSLDTPVCATQARRFNEASAGLDNTVVLVVSGDLPFAQDRATSVATGASVWSTGRSRVSTPGRSWSRTRTTG